MIYYIVVSYRIILMPARNGTNIILRLIYFLCACKKTIHIAIGGWLFELLSEKSALLSIEKKNIAVLVQLKSLEERLRQIGVSKAEYFPNYRNFSSGENSIDVLNKKNSSPLKFVYYSRVSPAKGIEEAIKAVDYVNRTYRINLELHVYGPIDEKYSVQFYDLLKQYKATVYCGILRPGEVLSVLFNYDCMLFPTYYIGEGYPGAVLEAFASGVPVIASKWRYNEEIIENNKTGLFCEIKSFESLAEKIIYINNNVSLLREMSLNCYAESEKFSEKTVFPILAKYL